MLLRPLLIAMAVGFAVSVAQFLPTLFAGGGRFGTLATETLSLSGGGDRRIIGRFGFALAALPFVGFALALARVRLALSPPPGHVGGHLRCVACA